VSLAVDVLDSGEASVVLAGGVDSLTRLTLNGFSSLLIVAAQGCKPFDVNRPGMSLGEGAGVLVLESEEHALARGARIRGFIAGAASTCDAYHATAPHPDGVGIHRAMSRALEDAGLGPKDVDYVNAHGTGTLDNDLAEGRAIMRLFRGEPPRVSSTKGFFGHALAASGAIEAIVCLLAIEHQALPANLGMDIVDPEVGFEPVRRTQPARIRVALSNSMGFGGNNCALLISGPF
jgi:3-oxoacyl-(acyl-carrier-protein) synthase